MFLGLRTVIYPAPDLAASKAWFAQVLGTAPYFDEPFYVGFDVGGYELGLLPEAPAGAALAYWGVPHVEAALATLVAAGATVVEEVRDVGKGIRTAGVQDPGGAFLGIIENPHFQAPAAVEGVAGPGR